MVRRAFLLLAGLLLVLSATTSARNVAAINRQLLQASGAVADATPVEVQDVIFEATIGSNGTIISSKETRLPASAKGFDPTKTPKTKPASKGDAIQAKVEERLSKKAAAAADTTSSESFRVLVTFTEVPETRMPRFPKLSNKDPASKKAEKIQQGKEMADALVRNRRAHISAVLSDSKVAKQTVKEVFVAGNIATMDLTAGDIASLEKVQNVLRIEEDLPVEVPVTNYPTTDGNADNDMEDARSVMWADPYYSTLKGEAAGVYIGLVDIGVRATHALLQGRLHYTRDCRSYTGYTPQSNCCPTTTECTTSGWGQQDGWCAGGSCTSSVHGTASASAITANSAYGSPYRGMTAVRLDSYRIFYESDMVRAIGAAAIAGSDVIAAVVQATSLAVNTAANNAYNAGRAVVAAAGNYGCSTTVNGGCDCASPSTGLAGSVRTPASAHKAIAVGAADLQTYIPPSTWGSPQPMCYSGRGPTPDGRVKPDILGLTNVETGWGSADNALTVFSGTSCATPVAAGAAAALYAWIGTNQSPGILYAGLLASGMSGSPFAGFIDNNRGAGIIRLPVNTRWSYGSTTVSATGQYVDIPMNTVATGRPISAAIWWPQEYGAARNDVDLALYRIDSTGNTYLAGSASADNVWEKVLWNPTSSGANYFIRINGYNLRTGAQLVHYFMTYQ